MAILGQNSNNTSTQTNSADRKYCYSALAGSGGIVTDGVARIWLDAAGSSPCHLMIYSDSAGSPSTLLAVSDDVTISNTAEAAVAFTFSGANQITLVSGTNYWIGIHFTDPGTPNFVISRANTGVNTVASSLDTYSDGTSSAFGAITLSNGPLDIYMNYGLPTIKFLEPGGDATFDVDPFASLGFWSGKNSSPAVASDFVHGTHQKSIKYRTSANDGMWIDNALSDAGARISFWLYINALPSANTSFLNIQTSGGANCFFLRISTTGNILLINGAIVQLASSSIAMTTGAWHRIAITYWISSTGVNKITVWLDGVAVITLVNASIPTIGTFRMLIGNNGSSTDLDIRTSDHYIDASATVTDPGNIWVTAKRPVSNGALNQLTTQIGSGGSGYGSGHSPQVNERPISISNGWSGVVTATALDEKYNVEALAVGDIDISTAHIVGYGGWCIASALSNETGVLDFDTDFAFISLTTSAQLFFAMSAGTGYTGTGKDVGFKTAATSNTVSLYEIGLLVAYTPTVVSHPVTKALQYLIRLTQTAITKSSQYAVRTVKKTKLLFDGATTFVSAPDVPALALGNNDFYISLWLSITDSALLQMILAKYAGASYANNAGGQGFELMFRGDFASKQLNFRLNDGTGGTGSTLTTGTGLVVVNDGARHHIGITVSRTLGQMRMYVDGVAIQSATIVPTGSVTNTGALRIGKQSGTGTTNFLNGSTDIVVIGNMGSGFISSSTIADGIITDAKVATYDGTVVAQYDLDEGTGTIALDQGTGLNNGTITGGSWQVGIQKALQYAIRKSTALTRSLQYEIRTTTTAVTKSLQYEIRNTQTAITKAIQYEVKITPTFITKSLQYAIKPSVAITKALQYVLKSPVAITKALTYEIRTTHAFITKSLQYEVRGTPTAISKALQYEIKITQAAITKSLAYVVGQITTISVGLQYVVKSPVAITKSLRYAIKELVSPTITKTLQYEVRVSGTSITKQLIYAIKTLPGAIAKALQYEIRKPTAITKAIQYEIKKPAVLTTTLQYAVRKNTAVAISAKYEVRVPTTIAKQLKYVIKSSRPMTLPLAYFIVQSAPLTLPMQYVVVRQIYPYYPDTTSPYSNAASPYADRNLSPYKPFPVIPL